MKYTVNHKIIHILSSMILVVICFVGCKQEKASIPTKHVQHIDSLNTNAFKFLRKRAWENCYVLAKTADSLATIHNYKKGSARSLRIQAHYWNSKKQLDSALHVLQKSEKLEETAQNYKGLLAVYNTKALLFKKNEFYEEALANYKKGLALTDSSITHKQQISTHVNIANVYTTTGIYDSAIYHYQKSLLLNNQETTNRQTIAAYSNLGNVYSLSNNYKLAEFYYTKALNHYKEKENSSQTAKMYNNLGALFYEKGDDSLSLEYFKKSIQLKEKISDSSQLVRGYLNIAELYAKKNTALALNYLQKATRLEQHKKETSIKAKIHIARANIYQYKNQLVKAKSELQKAIVLSEGDEKLTLKRYIAKKQSEFAQSEGNYQKAYEYQLQYEVLNDSVFNEQKLWEIAALQKSYQSEVKKVEISLLEKERALAEEVAFRKQEENKKLYGYLIAFAIILSLVIIISVYFYKLKKAANQLANQQEILLKQKMQNLVNDQEIQIINATLSAKEKEKEEISKELHNNIGSLLTSVKFHFQAFDKNVIETHEGTKKLYEKTNQILDNVTDEVRAISHRFDKDPIPEFNLENAITNFSKKVENRNLKVYTTIHGLETFQNSQTSIFIFRILQELVNNVLKHAQASELSINITRNSNHINMMVEDNGKGFKVEKKRYGIGLKNLKKELKILDGSCHIDSNELRGTIVNIDIPIH
ncbi:Oxygen sensor histidine kinase NreB [Kordia antarctica]|uniref:histidine kinase n=1 Tax=Kordia antarctica TaxID=1218801 RepID=A0A7L4ZFM6_9FLAO|nr:tetratricopeptide repeat protein [Kordia antarctica]QHI35472.1 Oxygen sensor histidine kinase NreB [Kordia antarctica]